MCFEYAIAIAISLFIAVVAIYLSVRVDKLEDENENLQEIICSQERCISDQECNIETLERELAKKESLISILRNEIEEEENAK